MPLPETMRPGGKSLLRALGGEPLDVPPIWLMRQAGRYLPEYLALRAKAPDFLSFCLTPELAAEATLQPIRRFGFDAAIVFSDILVVPHALGQRVAFREGEGPVLDALRNDRDVRKLEPGRVAERTAPVRETLRQVRAVLPADVALIGFAGAPWTVATYMVEGGSSRDFRRVKGWAYRDAEGFDALIGILVESTIKFLTGQIEAGAEVVQLFDTWAGVLPEPAFERWVIEPTRTIITALKQRFPDHPIIGFPRGAGLLYERYVQETGVDGIGLDPTVPSGFARERLQPLVTIQGNLDPILLITGGSPLEAAVRELVRSLGGGPFIFNLGHGVLPQTPPENVEALARFLSEPTATT
jgi:uroporphyrinogen decarboxylase